MSSCAVSRIEVEVVARLPFCVGRQVGDFDGAACGLGRPARPDGCPGFPAERGQRLQRDLCSAQVQQRGLRGVSSSARRASRAAWNSVPTRAVSVPERGEQGRQRRRVLGIAPPLPVHHGQRRSGRQAASGGPGFRHRGAPARRGPFARRLRPPPRSRAPASPRVEATLTDRDPVQGHRRADAQPVGPAHLDQGWIAQIAHRDQRLCSPAGRSMATAPRDLGALGSRPAPRQCRRAAGCRRQAPGRRQAQDKCGRAEKTHRGPLPCQSFGKGRPCCAAIQ
jgi:hypothetical protein